MQSSSPLAGRDAKVQVEEAQSELLSARQSVRPMSQDFSMTIKKNNTSRIKTNEQTNKRSAARSTHLTHQSHQRAQVCRLQALAQLLLLLLLLRQAEAPWETGEFPGCRSPSPGGRETGQRWEPESGTSVLRRGDTLYCHSDLSSAFQQVC